MVKKHKWKNKPRVLQFALYMGMRFALCLFQMISTEAGITLAGALAWILFTVDRRHRLLALENLRKAFPGRYSETMLNKMVLATYRHFIMLFVEIPQLPRKIHRHNVDFHLDLGPKKQTILDLMRSDRPLLIVTGHFGNWELAGVGLGALGFKTFAVARPLDNPYLDIFVRRIREHMGQTVLAKRDLSQIQGALAKGGKIAVLADQYAGPRGQMVNFFGRSAAAYKGISVLAMQYRAPLLVVGLRKVGEPMRYRAVLEDIIYPEEYTGFRAEAVRQITQRYTTALERVICSAPEQYLWLHNRWKAHRQPKTSLAKAA